MLSDASKWLMNVVGCVSSASTRFEMNAGGGWAAVGKNTGDLELLFCGVPVSPVWRLCFAVVL